jgi:adenylosuccinate synthase
MEEIRGKGNEFGATTGRPRRCGWFDVVMGSYSVKINGVNSLAVMKLDVLDELKSINVCVGYKYKGKIFKNFPADMEVLTQSKPIYKEYAGWQVDTTKALKYSDLPIKAKNYLAAIEGLLKTKIGYISVGSKRNQTIFR